MIKTMNIQAKAMLALAATVGLIAFAPSSAQAQSKIAYQASFVQAPAFGNANLGGLKSIVLNSATPAGSNAPIATNSVVADTNQPKNSPVIPEYTPGIAVVTRTEFPRDTPKPGADKPQGGEQRNLGRLESVQSFGQIASAPTERRVDLPRRPVINMLENRLVVSAPQTAKMAGASRQAAVQALDGAKPLI